MNKLQEKALVYSLDDNIKISDLKKNNYSTNLDFEKISSYLEQNNINYLVNEDNNFPLKLKKTKSSPYIVYYIGNISLLEKYIIGIAGPRKKTSYGENVLKQLFENIKWKDIATVSWMAPWIDSTAHKLSIEYNIPTIAVLWGWLAHFLSTFQRNFINYIIENNWLVISEFKLKKKPANYTFPQRNRLIAGISDFLFIPEAWETSWSLITVDFANNMKIPVYWPPGSIFSANSKGINKYIYYDKITPVYDIQEFCEYLFDDVQNYYKNHSIVEELESTEKLIYETILQNQPITVEEICNKKWLSQTKIFWYLTTLEIKWIINETSPGKFETC